MSAPAPQGFTLLAKVAIGIGVATVGMGVATFTKHQIEMRSSTWLLGIKEKLNDHRGVKVLFGESPVSLGVITRRKPSYELPSKELDPPPSHLLTMNVRGEKSRGILYAWLSNPSDKKIESINDWDVAHMELQVGKNREKKMPIT